MNNQDSAEFGLPEPFMTVGDLTSINRTVACQLIPRLRRELTQEKLNSQLADQQQLMSLTYTL